MYSIKKVIIINIIVFLFGIIIGAAILYYATDSRINALENELSECLGEYMVIYLQDKTKKIEIDTLEMKLKESEEQREWYRNQWINCR